MNIIGITEGHTCTAALMKEGKIVACVSEERFNRKKATEGFPLRSIQYLLTFIDKEEIDLVACASEAFDAEVLMVDREATFSINDHIRQQREHFHPVLIEGKDPVKYKRDFYEKMLKEKTGGKKLGNYEWGDFEPTGDVKIDRPRFQRIRIETIKKHLGVSEENIVFVNHHQGHAAYAYYASPFRDKECVVVTADGMGDRENATVSVVRDNRVEEIFRTDMCNVGKIWRYATLLLGMKPQEHEYKVMGLAPYADYKIAELAYKVYNEHLVVDGMDFKYQKRPRDLYYYFKDLLEGVRFDGVAGGLQKWSEEIITKWMRNIITETGIHRVVFSGGIAMNIKVNKAIHEMPEVEEFYVAPSGGDESLAIGVCYATTKDNPEPLDNIYLGPEYSDEECLRVAQKGSATGRYELLHVDAQYIAKQISKGLSVARFSGRMEFGARALGNRSILADPSRHDQIRQINTQIKKRDFWMPFTPSILKEREKDYIVNPKEIECPYMTIAFDSTKRGKKEFVAAIHPYDETVRPQLVEQKRNPGYHGLLKEFERITGIGGILNTSFNLHGDAIVCSPEDAFYTMENCDLDILFMNDKIALKRIRIGQRPER
jgi:carbamoyltransferase